MELFCQLIRLFVTGILLFLFGIFIMRLGLNRLAGKRLTRWLLYFTRTPVSGFFSGALTTIMVQSSSIITVLTVGFLQTGLITFEQSLGVVLGANVGSVATVQLLALKIDRFALPILIIAIFLLSFQKKNIEGSGLILSGLSLIFLAMEEFEALAPLLEESNFLQKVIVELNQSLILGIIFAIIFSALIQSSAATIALAIAFVGSGIVTIPLGIAVVLGSNIGTCFTAILASIGGNKAGKQMALANLIFNILGVLLFYPFISVLANITAKLAVNPAQQIAHSQLIFNIISSLIMLPFTKQFAYLIKILLPDK